MYERFVENENKIVYIFNGMLENALMYLLY